MRCSQNHSYVVGWDMQFIFPDRFSLMLQINLTYTKLIMKDTVSIIYYIYLTYMHVNIILFEL